MQHPLQRLSNDNPADWRAYAHDLDVMMRDVGPHHEMFAAMADLRNLALDVAVAIEFAPRPEPREWR